MTSQKIVFGSIVLIVVVGLLVLNPSMITNVQAVPYDADYDNRYSHGDQYGDQYDNSRYDDNRYGYDNYDSSYYPEPKKDKKTVNQQEIKCFNKNLNVNGIDITQIPQDGTALAAANEGAAADATNTQNNNGVGDKINFDRNLVNICVNVNVNEQIRTSTPAETTCEECFEDFLSPDEITTFVELFGVESIERFCILFTNPENELVILEDDFRLALPGVESGDIEDLIECLEDKGVVFITETPI
jgi:hypothetical protein